MEKEIEPMARKTDKKIRVMLVDDHAMLRRGLALFLKAYDDMELVGEAGDGRAAIEKCGEFKPDVILMDMSMPVMSGAEATREILGKYPFIKVVALTSYSDTQIVDQALNSGAIGYLLKNVSPDELASAIRNAYKGKATLASEAAQAVVNHRREKPTDFDLTPRETEVMALLACGKSNKEIAKDLTISPSTIKTHVSNILGKLGVKSRTEAVAKALNKDSNS